MTVGGGQKRPLELWKRAGQVEPFDRGEPAASDQDDQRAQLVSSQLQPHAPEACQIAGGARFLSNCRILNRPTAANQTTRFCRGFVARWDSGLQTPPDTHKLRIRLETD